MAVVHTWTIVNFTKDNTVEAVPTIWLRCTAGNEQKTCYWPPFSGDLLTNTIKRHEPPNKNWELLSCRTFKNGTFDDYSRARKQTKKAEETSDLSSDNGQVNKKRKIKPRQYSVSSDEDAEQVEDNKMPDTPKMTKKSAKRSSLKQVNSMENENTADQATNISTPDNTKRDEILTDERHMNTLQTQISALHGNPSPLPPVFDDLDLRNSLHRDSQIDSADTISATCHCYHHQQKVIELLNVLTKKESIQRRALTEILEEISDIKKRIGNLAETPTGIPDEENYSIFKSLTLPIMNLDEIAVLEDHLSDDINMKKAKVEIARLGGRDGGDFIRRAVSRLMEDQVLKRFNWEGKKGKEPFKRLKTANLLLGALSMSQNITNELEGVQHIKNYMKNASERVKQKMK